MAKSKPAKTGKDEPEEKIICRNKKAGFKYELLEVIEAGLVLTGTEVKSLRAGKANIEESYVKFEAGEVWLLKADIPEYAMGNIMNHEPKRKRKLLLHRLQIDKFAKGAAERGFTIIPVRLYFTRGKAKIAIALAKGRKLHDKRESIKERDVKRQISRATGQRRH